MAYNIGAKIQLEGEKEYRQQLESIKKSQKELESQTKRLSAEFEDNADSVEYLTQKQEILNAQSDKNSEKIDIIKSRLEVLGEEYRKNADGIDEYRKAIAQTEESLEKMRESGEASEQALKEQENTLMELEKALSRAENAQRKMSDTMTTLRTNLNDAETAAYQTEREIRNVATALEESSDEGDEFGESVKDSFGSAGEVVGGFSGKLLDIMDNFSKARESGVTASEAMTAAVAGGLVPAVVDLVGQLKEAQTEYDKMKMEAEESLTKAKLSLGLTEEETAELAKSIERIYLEGVVASREEAAEAMTAVRRLIGETGDQAEQTAKSVIGIKEVFGSDYTETIKTASTVMKTFEIDSEAALDLIYNGLQSSANKSEDLLDILNEHSNSFERLGYTEKEFLSGLVAAADAGAFSVNTAADAVKEFYNGAVDASEDYNTALSDLGLKSEEVTDQIVKGGEEGKEALQEVLTRLGNMTDETEQAKVAVRLFGSQWEDVGTEAILAFTKSSKAAENFTTTTEDLIEELGNTTEAWSLKMQRAFEAIAPAIVDSLLGPIGMINSLQTSIAEAMSSLSQLGRSTSGSPILPALSSAHTGYATGVASAVPGVHAVAENGPELVTRPTYRNFSGGERVYNAQQTGAILGSSLDTDRIVSAIQSLERKLEIQQNNVNQFTIDLRSAKDINTLIQYFENEQRRGRAR